MGKTERIRIAERADMVRTRKAVIAGMVEAGNELAELYRGLKIGDFTAETLADAFNGDYSKAKRLYREQLQAEADGFRSVAMRDEVMKEAEAFNTPYARKVDEMRRTYGSRAERELMPYLTVTDAGQVVFTDESAKRLADDTALWIDDPDEIAKYRQHGEIVRMLNEFFGGRLPFGWFNFFPLRDGVFTMPENGTDYRALLRKPEQDTAHTPEPVPEQDGGQKADKPDPKQRNKQRGGMVKGITKVPDYNDRGAELRKGEHKISPEY